MFDDSGFLFLVAQIICGFGMAYTSPSSKQRPFVLVLIIICCLISIRSSIWERLFGTAGLIAYEYIIGFMFHSSYWLCLAKLCPPPSATTKSAKNWWSFNQVFNSRIGIVYLPAFDSKNPSYVPSRSKLFFSRLWDLIWLVGVIYVLDNFHLNIQPEDFMIEETGFLDRILAMTPREAIIRLYMVMHGYGLAYCALRAAHSAASCIALAFGDSPERWRPLFGSITDATTVRRWYSHFWHHLMRKAFTAHASLIVNDIFRLPRRGPITRYSIIFITFLFSAVLHILASPGIEWCTSYFQFRYYITVIGIILCEDLFVTTVQSRVYTSTRDQVQIEANGPAESSKHDSSKKGSTKSDPGKTMDVRSKKADEAHSPPASLSTPRELFWSILGFSWVLAFQVWALSELAFGQSACYIAEAAY